MTPDRKARTIRTARHEAAHAVLAYALGFPVYSAEIRPDGTGVVLHGAANETNEPQDPFRLAVVALAGHAAEMKWHRQSRTKVEQDDHLFVVSLGFWGRSLPTLLQYAEGMVDEMAEAIEAVAQELKRRDLSGIDVMAICANYGIFAEQKEIA